MDKYAKIYIDELNKQAGLIDGIVRNIRQMAPKILPAVKDFGNGALDGLGSMADDYARILQNPNIGFLDKLKKSLISTFDPVLDGLGIGGRSRIHSVDPNHLGFVFGTALPAGSAISTASKAIKSLLPDDSSSSK